MAMLADVTTKRPNLRLAKHPSDAPTRVLKRRAPRAGSTRALTPGDVNRLLEQLADVVTAAKEVVRTAGTPGAHGNVANDRRRLEAEVRTLVFAGNCLWAAADGWQEHEALVDLHRYGSRALERALQLREGAGAALDAAALFRAEHSLRTLVTSVLDDIETSSAAAMTATAEHARTRGGAGRHGGS